MSHPLPSNENLHETPDAHYHYDNPAFTNVELTTDAPPGGSPQRPPRRSHAPPPDDAAVGSKDPRPDYRESLPHYTGGVIDSKPHDSRDSYALTVDGKTSAGDVVPPPDPTPGVIERCFDGVTSLYAKHRRSIGIIVRVTALLLYAVYFFAAVAYAVRTSVRPLGVWPKGIKELIGVTCCVVAMAIYFRLKPIVAPHAEKVATPVGERLQRYWPWLKWVCYSVIVVAIVLILFAGLELHKTPSNLISAVGLLCLCLFCFVFSMHPTRVNWRPILWGLALQFIFGLLILRTSVGRQVFTWLGDKVTIFLNFTDAGAKFVLGQYEIDQCGNVVQVLKIFAFSVLPVIVFFSSVISVLYYLGVMQAVIQRVAWLMQFTMKTTAAESLNAAGNIFIGQSESPLMIKPYIKDMTKSELHAIMTGGFATVAGSVLGAYIKFNVSASHLLSASVMSAPAALAISKLFYPETEPSKTMTAEDVTLPKGKEVNVVEAAANGASTSIKLVANIAVNLIAFLAFLALINALLSWFGSLLGHPEVTFEFICSYVFMPLAFIMGVPWQDCRKVAELIGVKTFLNEFIAYERLGRYVINGELTARSEVIATYALCGFSNIGSVGIMIGTLGAMAPSRKSDLAEIAVRALVAGTVACFMTACIAGLLIDDPSTIGRASSSFTVNGTQVECP